MFKRMKTFIEVLFEIHNNMKTPMKMKTTEQIIAIKKYKIGVEQRTNLNSRRILKKKMDLKKYFQIHRTNDHIHENWQNGKNRGT